MTSADTSRYSRPSAPGDDELSDVQQIVCCRQETERPGPLPGFGAGLGRGGLPEAGRTTLDEGMRGL